MTTPTEGFMSPTAEISRLATASPFPEPRLYKVIATQVSPYIAEAELRKLFSVAGPPASLRLMHSADGTFVGIVLAEYLDPIQVERVVEKLNGLPVLESNLIVEKVVPSPQVFPRPPTSDRLFKTQRLYAGNLPYDVTVEELEQLFSRYGPVKDVHMGRDRKTGLSKGYAFIEYSDEEDARDARDGLQGFELRGRALRLDVNVKQMQTPTPGRNTPATPNPTTATPTPANLPLSPPPIGAIRPIGLPAPSATLPKSPIVFSGPLNGDPPPIGASTPVSSSLYAPFPATFGSFPAFASTSPTSSLFPSRKDSSVWYSPDLSYANQKRLSVLLCGDARVGKSTWLQRLARGNFLAEYTPTTYVSPTLLRLSTSHGRIELQIWECAGRGYAQSLASSGGKGQAVILMFNVADRASYNSLDEQHAIVSRLVDAVPMVLVANQTDARVIPPQDVLFHRKKNIPLVEMSVKAAQNLYAPIESLLRRLVDPGIQILDQTEPQEIADSLSGLTLHNF